MNKSSVAQGRRDDIREQYWPTDVPWTGADPGWFKAPRSLPLLLVLMRSKAVSGRADPSSVYLEILSRHYGGGVVEMAHEKDHACAAGYSGSRAVRTWQERVRLLEQAGFICVQRIHDRIQYVLLVHPGTVVETLRKKGRVDSGWLDAYRERRRLTKEPDPPSPTPVLPAGSQKGRKGKKRGIGLVP